MKLQKKQKTVIFILITLRLLLPFLIFYRPLIGVIICLSLDWLDAGILYLAGIKYFKGKNLEKYHVVDKSLDMYYQTFILIYFLVNQDPYIQLPLIILYIYRFIGFTLFQITRCNVFFILFPNFFEVFALLSLILKQFFSPELAVWIDLLFYIAVILNMLQEILLHSGRYQNLLNKSSSKAVSTFRRIFRLKLQ